MEAFYFRLVGIKRPKVQTAFNSYVSHYFLYSSLSHSYFPISEPAVDEYAFGLLEVVKATRNSERLKVSTTRRMRKFAWIETGGLL
ncbi:hypothetical protein LOAG_19194, partial [Loa loa]